MKEGTVKFFNESKGFGFIICEGQEYFVHISDTLNLIRDNDTVSFELAEGRKGINAVKVQTLR